MTAFVTRDPSLPVITHYDDTTGERTELSAATLANWVAKTANLLVDGCGLGLGDPAVVALPPHWQTAAVLLGVWRAGLIVADAGDVLFAADPADETKAADRYLLGFAPMGMPMRQVPAGWADYVAEVRQFGDHFGGPLHRADRPDLVARGAELGLPAGSRVVIDAVAHPSPRDWLLAPFAVGSTVVLVTGTDPAKLAAKATAERAVLPG